MFPIISKTIRLHGAANSMQGGRPENQDDLGFIDTPLGFLFVVCDGMGGGPGGKTASAIAKQEIARHLNSCNQLMPRKQALRIAVAKANDALAAAMAANKELRGMGTTVVAILINSHSAIVCHAGDSRCYRMHGRLVLSRTQDHSLVGELVRKKVLSEEEARVSPQSNVISKSLGSKTDHNPDIEEMGYRKGDRFILCTDGVWGSMPHKKLLKLFAAKGQPANIVGRISGEVDRLGFAKGGKHDNHTIAVIDMDCNSGLHDKWYKIMLSAICGIAALAAIIAGACIYSATSDRTSAQNATTGSHGSGTAITTGGNVSTASQEGGKTFGDMTGNTTPADTERKDTTKSGEKDRDTKASDTKAEENGKDAAADKKEEKSGKDTADAAKLKDSIDKALEALKNMVEYHNEDEKKTKDEKLLHAKKVISALENVKKQCGKGSEGEINDILGYANKNRNAMAGVSKGTKTKKYGSSPEAQKIIKTIKEKIEKIKEKAK